MSAVTEGQIPEAPITPTEQPATEKPVASEERLSPQFAALARKEKALRAEANKLKSERESWLQEQGKFKGSDYVPKERLQREAIQVLNEMGMSHDQIAQMLLSQPTAQDPRIPGLLAKIEELEGKTNKIDSTLNDSQAKAVEQAVNQIRNEAKILIDSDAAYETIKASDGLESVVEHIKRTYEEDGVFLSVEDAAKEVEEALVEQAIRLAGLSKVKQKLQPPVEDPKLQQTRQSQPIKTLTHDMTSAPTKTLTPNDRRQRAIMRAQGLDPDTGKPLAG